MARHSSRAGTRAPASAVLLAACLGACSSPAGTRLEMEVGAKKVVLTRGIVNVEGGTLMWEESGDGPPVVLLHPGPFDSRAWDDQFAPLAEHYRVIRYDLRGHGNSSPPAGPYAHHEDLLALVDLLELQQVHLVGLSLGASVAVDFALEHPERVASLALASPGLSGWTWGRQEWRRPLAQAVAAHDEQRVVEARLSDESLAPAMEQPALADRLRQMARDNVACWMAPDPEVPLEPPAVARLGDLHGPLLLLIGARDTFDIHAIVERLATVVPGARVATFDGAGHLPNMEQPEAFNRELLGWLAEVAH
jgi:pimeloyl-ACP methyl ester carboxylesterase